MSPLSILSIAAQLLFFAVLVAFLAYVTRQARPAPPAPSRPAADKDALLREVLPIVGHLDRALRSARDQPTVDALAEGVRITQAELLKVLARCGLSPMDPVGQPFDPRWHHAALSIGNSDADPNTVLFVVERGYLREGQLFKPAAVAVADRRTTAA